MRKALEILSSPHSLKQWGLDKKHILSLFLIITLGFALRINNISVQELWYDEAYTAEIITNSYKDIFLLSQQDVHPPFYYFLLKTWTYFGNSEAMLRFPSVFFGTALIPLVYIFVKYLTNDNAKSTITALLIATNPFLVMYSREARSYSLLAFLTIIVTFELFRSLKNKSYTNISILMSLLFFTHYIGIFLIAIVTLVLFIHDKRSMLWIAPVFGIILFWIPTLIKNSTNVGLNWIPNFYWMRIPESFQSFFLGITGSTLQPAIANNPFYANSIIVSLLISGLFIFQTLKYKQNPTSKILLLCSLIPISLIALAGKYMGINFYMERYIVGYFSILLVYISISMPKKLLPLTLVYAALCIALVLNTKTTTAVYKNLSKSAPSEILVMSNASEFIILKYYLKSIKLQDGDWSSWGIIKESDILDKKNSKNNFYLVNKGPIKNFKEKFKLEGFYFYEWNI